MYLVKKMNEMLRGASRAVLFLLLFQGLGGDGSEFVGDGRDFGGDYSKLSGIIIPGFASTQLRAWSILDCPYSPLDFNPLDLVWLDTTKVSLSLSLHIFFICWHVRMKPKLMSVHDWKCKITCLFHCNCLLESTSGLTLSY